MCIIDIGSYKLRLCAARFKNKKIELLGYTEKRQDISYFANQECLNLPGLCTNISEAIEKLERETGEQVSDIVINYPFGELFLSSKKINYKRDLAHKNIDLEEIESIMQSVEKLCLKKLIAEVEHMHGLSQDEIQIILSRVNSITLDGKHSAKINGKEGENLKISLMNAFIPLSKHNLIVQIWNVLEKNIYKILPSEYCITKIFPQKDIVIINLGATQTSVSLKLEGDVHRISKIPIWVNDLVNKIAKQYSHRRAAIIENIWTELYSKEKQNFLRLWGETLGITIKEILWNTICPKEFYIGGGGANNDFIKDFIADFPFHNYGIKSFGKIEFVSEDLASVFKSMKHIKLEDIWKIPLDMYTLLLETNHLISREQDIVSRSLKTAIKKLGYIKE